jgi:hypothetical protein
VAAGAKGYRPLATVRSSCDRDAFAVEVRLLDWNGEAYRVQRRTGVGCGAGTAKADAVGQWVVDEIKASCAERSCKGPPPPKVVACGGPGPRAPWSIRAGAGVLSSARVGPSGAVGLGVAWAFSDHVALDADAVGSWLPARDRSGTVDGPIGYGVGRAHLMAHAGVHASVAAGLGGGALVTWTGNPDARIGGRARVVATGLVSALVRASVPLSDTWAVYAGFGAGFGVPLVRLSTDDGAVAHIGRPIFDGTLGLQWSPRRR